MIFSVLTIYKMEASIIINFLINRIYKSIYRFFKMPNE